MKLIEILTKDFLIENYVNKKREISDIAREIGCSLESVRKYLIKFKIPVRPYYASLKRRFKGAGNPNYKGGRPIDIQGYVLVKCVDHESSNKQGYILEHRLVMEKHLGRRLKASEVIHHIDGNKQNNKLSNLMLFPNRKAHFKFRHNSDKTFICKKCGFNQKDEL